MCFFSPKSISVPGESVVKGLIIFYLPKEKKNKLQFLNKDLFELNHSFKKFVTIPQGVIFKK